MKFRDFLYPEQPNRLIDSGELCQILGLKAVETVMGWRRNGKGPRFIKLQNGRIRYQLSDVKRWLKSQKTMKAIKTDCQGGIQVRVLKRRSINQINQMKKVL